MIQFLFNPKDYSMSLQSGWNFKPSKKSAEPPEFTGNQMRTLDVEVFLDATDDAQGTVAAIVELLFSTVRPTQKSLSANTPFPPIVVFSWGDAAVRRRRQVGQRHDHAVPAVRAPGAGHVQGVAAGVRPAPGGQNPTSGALRSNSSHHVTLGDSLASIAKADYGNPDLWRAIAAVNEIEDPFNMRIGTELLIPAPADAAGLV